MLEDEKKSSQIAKYNPPTKKASDEDLCYISEIKHDYALTSTSSTEWDERIIDWGDLKEEERNIEEVGIACYTKNKKKFIRFEGGSDYYTMWDNVETICDCAFQSYYNEHILIPCSIKILGDSIFWYPSIKELVIPESVTKMTGNPFATCKFRLKCHSPNFYFDGNVLYDKEKKKIVSVMRNFQIIEENDPITFSETVLVIERNAFYDVSISKPIVLPNSVLYIGFSAFYHASIYEIKLGEMVIEIGEYAFAFSSIESIKLPNSLEILGKSAFSCCPLLKSVELSASLAIIEEETFSGCNEINDIYIPEGVKEIRKRAFSSCKKLTNIYFPNSLEKIESEAFSLCGFKTIVIPKHTIVENGRR